MCGKMVKGIPARLPRRSNSVPKLLADIGPPRSLVNTYGDASCSRCRRRKARISSPCIGCTEGVPFLLLRTCSRPVLISTWRQLGVPDRVLDVLVAEPCLQRPRIVPGIGQGVATGVPQHVREDREGHAGALAEALE